MTHQTVSSALTFSKIVPVETIPPDGRQIVIEAGDDARAEIARRLQIPAVTRLRGVFDLKPYAGGVDVALRLDAALQRECVVSLETFEELLREDFTLRFQHADASESEIEVHENSPEPLDAETLDLGDILVQQAALAMDPYPRKPGARPLAEVFAPKDVISPFSGLKAAIAKSRGRE